MDIATHPYADLFPMMNAVELDALTADIAENGIRQPIVLYKDQVLDGRNRLLACQRANIEPAFTTFEGTDDQALDLVLSLNVQRRDLTAAQRALVAARFLPHFEALRPKGRPKKAGKSSPLNGRSRDDAAKLFKVNDKYIQQAKAILTDAPDLAVEVEACRLTLTDAYAQLPEWRARAAQRARDAARVARFAEAISNGEMTAEEALDRAVQEDREEEQRLASQADARKSWLQGFAEHLTYFERFVCNQTDDYLAWYGESDSPGMFDHGITPERIDAVVEHLRRSAALTFGGQHG